VLLPIETLWWTCGVFFVYTWAIFPAALWIAGRLRSAPRDTPGAAHLAEPTVSVIVTVHNEERRIHEKLRGILTADYPARALQVVVASDGSSDATVRIAQAMAESDARLAVHEESERRGKSPTQNAAMLKATGEIVVFTDAGTRFDRDFLREIVRPFWDRRVGAAAARLAWTNVGSRVARGGSAYWRYEQWLWALENRLDLLVCASGACFAIRRELFRPIAEEVGEDSVVPLDVICQGSVVRYAPRAVAWDTRASDPGAEWRARVRMTLRSFLGTSSRMSELLQRRKVAALWAVATHKICRWLTPYMMLGVLVSNVALTVVDGRYRATLGLQLGFYGVAALGWLGHRLKRTVPVAAEAYAFCLSEVATGYGMALALAGRVMVTYERQDA
jgi:cellulose synthase/poly-beta-1,6-N-acetylglucosamine synthase-like glycosyltransferase